MAAPAQKFYCLWQENRIRETLFGLLSKDDICAVRVANSACCNLLTKRLFLRTNITFTANTFTRACRIQALSRVGQHIEHLSFTFAHSETTFLPPLIHPQTGKEINFLYTPHTSAESAQARPKYGQSELGDILTQQYPPLFHAATNVPSFITALGHLPNLRHLTIRTPGQDSRERYRRDTVDYALISLRIAVERAPLTRLNKLSLSGVHPAAFNYLRHGSGGFGSVPSAPRRWAQIRKLYVSVEAWDFYGPSPGLDHLKMIDDYVRGFADGLDKFAFTWLGHRGPCPLALAADPLFAPPRSGRKLFNEVTSPMSPLPPAPGRAPVVFPRLRYLQVRNATMSAAQLRELVASHRGSVREFDFDNVALLRGGTWAEALAPLTARTSSPEADCWSQTTLVGMGSTRNSAGSGGVVGVGNTSEVGSYHTVASSQDELELPSPSAAVAAASRELLEMDLEQVVFGESGKADGVEQWRQGVGAAATAEEERHNREGLEDDLRSEIAAAREASQGFSTKLKKRRIRKRSKEITPEPEHEDSEEERHRRHRSHSRHKRSHSDGHEERRHRSHSRRHLRRHRSEELPPPMPEVIGSDDERFRPASSRRSKQMSISAPILDAAPMPATLLLQPTVYDPAAVTAHCTGLGAAGRVSAGSDFTSPAAAAAAAAAQADDGLSAVQRGIEQEMRLAEEAASAAARTSALRKAKEAVLSKLSREFCRKRGGGTKESAAVGGLANFSLGSCAAAAQSSSVVMGLRYRDGLFGKSSTSVVPDHRSLESQTALVPLMFSRS